MMVRHDPVARRWRNAWVVPFVQPPLVGASCVDRAARDSDEAAVCVGPRGRSAMKIALARICTHRDDGRGDSLFLPHWGRPNSKGMPRTTLAAWLRSRRESSRFPSGPRKTSSVDQEAIQVLALPAARACRSARRRPPRRGTRACGTGAVRPPPGCRASGAASRDRRSTRRSSAARTAGRATDGCGSADPRRSRCPS